jgi:uncharacterized membrane protein YfcA
MDFNILVIVAVVFLAGTFVQASIGFGLALVTMPILVSLLSIHVAAPLVAIAAIIVEIAILLRYREAFNFSNVKHLIIAAIAGIPVGILAVRIIDGDYVIRALGVIVIGYALYALFTPELPELAGRAWAYLFGFLAGILGGAYNTSGPPVVIYGNCRAWPPTEFKSNLQGFFLINGLVVIAVHGINGNYSAEVFQNALYALPGIVLGLITGFYLSKRINAQLFHKIVLVALIFLGLSLLFV